MIDNLSSVFFICVLYRCETSNFILCQTPSAKAKNTLFYALGVNLFYRKRFPIKPVKRRRHWHSPHKRFYVFSINRSVKMRTLKENILSFRKLLRTSFNVLKHNLDSTPLLKPLISLNFPDLLYRTTSVVVSKDLSFHILVDITCTKKYFSLYFMY